MIRNFINCITFSLLLVIFTPANAVVRTGTNYTIRNDGITVSGGITSSSKYQVEGTLGQPTPPGTTQSSSYKLYSGVNTIPDTDGDGIYDDLDNDDDNDGVADNADVFPRDPTEYLDTDGDLIGDGSDNCPLIPNTNQQDSNNNGIGDACEADDSFMTLLLIIKQKLNNPN